MIVLGLTGSIGMGKSRAASMLRWMGVPTHDSDEAVHEALLPGGAGFAEVAQIFPEIINNGAIDRTKLGTIVFRDLEKLKKLEAILHPIARKSQEDFIKAQEARGKKIVVLEIPLLFETSAENRVDYTLCVSAAPDIQKARVMKRPNMTEEKFEKILSRQMPDGEKQDRSNFVVDTGSGYIKTFCQLRRIVKGLRE